MKTMTWLATLKTPAAVLSAALVALSTAAAAPPDRPRRPLPPLDSPRGDPGPRRGSHPGFGPESILNEEQRAQLRETMQANRERHEELARKIREARRELDGAMFAEKLNEKDVRKKAAAIAKLEAERLMLRARAFAKIRPTLTPGQLERIKNRRAEFASRSGPRFKGPLPERRFQRPEGRYREHEAPRPEARLREPRPDRPEPRFHEPRRPEMEERRPEFRGDQLERGRSEFRRDERRAVRPEVRRDEMEHRREFEPAERERFRPESRREPDEQHPRKRREPPPESGPEDGQRREAPPSPAAPESR